MTKAFSKKTTLTSNVPAIQGFDQGHFWSNFQDVTKYYGKKLVSTVNTATAVKYKH